MATEKDVYRVMVTGANSGLGFAIGCRLIDEFLYTRPQNERLAIVITTRDQKKSDETVSKLQRYLQKTIQQTASKGMQGFEKLLQGRVAFEQELLDLNSLKSVYSLAKRRKENGGHINALVLNAGIGGWVGINWPLAIWTILTDWVYAVTFPAYKISETGGMTRSQLSSDSNSTLGQVFCSNVFGHYILAHELVPLLDKSGDGRIVWVSSIEAYKQCFSVGDLQGLESVNAYESSKRLTDILAISSRVPETRPVLSTFMSGGSGPSSKVRMYLSHPGICATGIFPLPWILGMFMVVSFYVARWLGSIWHTCTAYKGACAPVWLALAPSDQLEASEARSGIGKWGSATDISGGERAERTEVDGWGYGGIVGDGRGRKRGRVRGLGDLTAEGREEFVELGRQCWKEMEEMRITWEKKLSSEA